jgi:hypothetical protein
MTMRIAEPSSKYVRGRPDAAGRLCRAVERLAWGSALRAVDTIL